MKAEVEIILKEQMAHKRHGSVDGGDDIERRKQIKMDNNLEEKARQITNLIGTETSIKDEGQTTSLICIQPKTSAHAAQSPKKRLQLSDTNKRKAKSKEKFIYGNYSQYYGYRNKDFQDVRLNVFETRRELFEQKDVLDIGCNNGFITAAVAKRLNVRRIVGIDIDRGLINQAIKNLTKAKKALPIDNKARCLSEYPYNVQYVHGNYVLKNDVLLEIERPQFDLILCLSITKWIQLNFGDSGLKQAFRRMFLQLRTGGHLILEAQPLKNYRKRKYLSEEARLHFQTMKFFPEQFTNFLLSNEIGFTRMEVLGVPEHCVEGFKRPIQVFFKE